MTAQIVEVLTHLGFYAGLFKATRAVDGRRKTLGKSSLAYGPQR
jgi:hypothetical protein